MHVHGSNRWVEYEGAGLGRVGEGRVGGVGVVVGVWRGGFGGIFAILTNCGFYICILLVYSTTEVNPKIVCRFEQLRIL